MEADHAKASAKIFFSTQGSTILQGSGAHPRLQRSCVRLTRRPSRARNERLSTKDGGKGCPRSRNFESFRNSSVSTQGSAILQGSGVHPRLQRSFVRLGPPLRLRRAT
jgi:hypothetical protein